jgi:hypothetical protein
VSAGPGERSLEPSSPATGEPVVTPITEVTLVGGERLRVDGDAEQVQALILAAARGSLMEFAWMTEADTGERIGVNPDHVLFLRAPTGTAPTGAA